MSNNVVGWARHQWSRFFPKNLTPEDAVKVLGPGKVCPLRVCQEVLGRHQSPFNEPPVLFTKKQLALIRKFFPHALLYIRYAELGQVVKKASLEVPPPVLKAEENSVREPSFCLVAWGPLDDLTTLRNDLRKIGLHLQRASVTTGLSALALAPHLGQTLRGEVKFGTEGTATVMVELDGTVRRVHHVRDSHRATQSLFEVRVV